jgi:hypothetical protein
MSVERLALARCLRTLIERRGAYLRHKAEGAPNHGD